jgi:hypothetical protein
MPCDEFRPAKIAIRASLARTAAMISLEREMRTYEVRPRESTADTISWKAACKKRRRIDYSLFHWHHAGCRCDLCVLPQREEQTEPFRSRDPRGKHNTRRTGKSANEIDSRVERTDGRGSGRPGTSTNHYVNAAYIRPN